VLKFRTIWKVTSQLFLAIFMLAYLAGALQTVAPAWAQDVLEWPGNMILRPLNPVIYVDGVLRVFNKSGTRTYSVGFPIAQAVPAIGTCGTSTATGQDGFFTIVITGGTPATCSYTLGNTSYSASAKPACWYVDQTTANANGGKCAVTVSSGTATVTITPPTFTGAAANFATDTINVFVLMQTS